MPDKLANRNTHFANRIVTDPPFQLHSGASYLGNQPVLLFLDLTLEVPKGQVDLHNLNLGGVECLPNGSRKVNFHSDGSKLSPSVICRTSQTWWPYSTLTTHVSSPAR